VNVVVFGGMKTRLRPVTR